MGPTGPGRRLWARRVAPPITICRGPRRAPEPGQPQDTVAPRHRGRRPGRVDEHEPPGAPRRLLRPPGAPRGGDLRALLPGGARGLSFGVRPQASRRRPGADRLLALLAAARVGSNSARVRSGVAASSAWTGSAWSASSGRRPPPAGAGSSVPARRQRCRSSTTLGRIRPSALEDRIRPDRSRATKTGHTGCQRQCADRSFPRSCKVGSAQAPAPIAAAASRLFSSKYTSPRPPRRGTPDHHADPPHPVATARVQPPRSRLVARAASSRRSPTYASIRAEVPARRTAEPGAR